MSAVDLVMGSGGTSDVHFTVLLLRFMVVSLRMEMLRLHSDVYICTECGSGAHTAISEMVSGALLRIPSGCHAFRKRELHGFLRRRPPLSLQNLKLWL